MRSFISASRAAFAGVAISLLIISSTARAADFAAPLTQIDGKPLLNEDKSPVTLGQTVENALLISYPDEQNLAGEEKMKRFSLATKIHNNRKDPTLSAEEIATMKKLVAKAYAPLVVGQVWTMLDPASAK